MKLYIKKNVSKSLGKYDLMMQVRLTNNIGNKLKLCFRWGSYLQKLYVFVWTN